MDPVRVAYRRLHNQRLEGEPFSDPVEVVRWLGAVQSQDYGPAKWSLGERCHGVADADVDGVFNAGGILRTHLLRPTWHFVLPEDIRWMQEVTAPRVHALNAYYYRQTGLDDAGLRARCNRLIAAALRGGNHLTRRELEGVLAREGIVLKALGMVYVLMQAELDCVVCSGALKGRQHTYALFEERVPDRPPLTRDEALAELVVRYFTSRGPATAKDLRWWSSLSLAEIRQGVEAAGDRLRHEEHDGVSYWSGPARGPEQPAAPKVYLLQGYDEYFVGYSESRNVIGGEWGRPMLTESPGYLGGVVLDSQLVGRWKRAVASRAVTFIVALAKPFEDAQMQALHAAADRHGAFLGLPASVEAAVM